MTSDDATERQPSAGHQIAEAIRELILDGKLTVDQRLPGEQDLATRFGVSRPTVREALKRLAAQNLIRTRRGATGGNFVNRPTWSGAHDQLVATATLLMTMAPMPAETVAEARLSLLGACLPMAAERRGPEHLREMRDEIARQRAADISDEDFCASDVRFHRVLVEATDNSLIAFQMAGVVEAIQPILNMITYRERDRTRIADWNARLCDRLEARDTDGALAELSASADYTAQLAARAQEMRAAGGIDTGRARS